MNLLSLALFSLQGCRRKLLPKLLKPPWFTCSRYTHKHIGYCFQMHTHKLNTQILQGHGVIIRSQNSAQYLWLRSRGCWLIYRSSMWVCACRAFAYLLCHPAGSQLWAQHSGTMHLPRWIPAPDIWPIHHTRKVVMFTLRNLLGYACILVEICNLTIQYKARIVDCEAHDSVLVSVCVSLWEPMEETSDLCKAP